MYSLTDTKYTQVRGCSNNYFDCTQKMLFNVFPRSTSYLLLCDVRFVPFLIIEIKCV